MVRALGIFAVTYVLISRPHWPSVSLDRPSAGLVGAVLMVAAGVLTPAQAYRAIDWSTIALLLGMFLLAGCLRLSGFFDWTAETTLQRVRTPARLLAALVVVSGVLSALLVNDTVCVMLAPLVTALAQRSHLPTRPYLFALAAGTNVGSVMTVVGNPQNMIIANAAPVSYAEFARHLAPAGLVGLGLAVAVLRWSFRSELGPGAIAIRPSEPVYLLNPDADVDGLLLSDGTVVKFPPHLGAALTAAVAPGARVSVVGFPGASTPWGHAVHALSVTNTATGETVVDQPPAGPGIPPFARAATRTPLTVSGTVSRVLVNPPGDVDGLVLTSGEEVRFPPHLGQTVVRALGGQTGAAITASGYGARSAFGTAVEADSMVIGNQTLSLR